MDFVFATDHASNGVQVDGKIERPYCADAEGDFCFEARDLNPGRFAVAKGILYGPDGANEVAARDAQIAGFARLRTANIVPQVYMGEELDAWPEISAREHAEGVLHYGDGMRYPWPDSSDCIEKEGLERCRAKYSRPYAEHDHRSYLVLDEQGIPIEEEIESSVPTETLQEVVKFFTPDGTKPYPRRQHIVYFPTSSAPNGDGWIGSDTSPFGGAGKRLQDVLAEIEPRGFAFLAHPVESARPGSAAGPDVVPYSDAALTRAWRSPGILGLQL